MQLTNGAIKVGVQPPPMNPTALEEYEGVDLDTFEKKIFPTASFPRSSGKAMTTVNDLEVSNSYHSRP